MPENKTTSVKKVSTLLKNVTLGDIVGECHSHESCEDCPFNVRNMPRARRDINECILDNMPYPEHMFETLKNETITYTIKE